MNFTFHLLYCGVCGAVIGYEGTSDGRDFIETRMDIHWTWHQSNDVSRETSETP